MPFPLPQNWEQDTAWIMPDLLWEAAGVNFATDPFFKHFPFRYVDADRVIYDQYQNMGGLMPGRALGAAPTIVKAPGDEVYEFLPGYYGLEMLLEEEEMVRERQPNTINKPLDVQDRVGILALNASVLMVNRFSQTLGTFGTSGVIANRNDAGQIIHQQTMPNFQVLQPAGSGGTGPGWSANPATATPISDLQYWQTRILQPGTSASFGSDSVLMCNPTTVNTIWNTTQVQSTFRGTYGASFLRGDVYSPKLEGDNSINALFVGAGLPPIQVYQGGYYPTRAAAIAKDASQWQYTIPDNTLMWVGKRPQNQPVASCTLTRGAGITAPYASSAATFTPENEGKIELSKGIYVVAQYQAMIPQNYRIQVGVNMCPFIAYSRGIAGIRTG